MMDVTYFVLWKDGFNHMDSVNFCMENSSVDRKLSSVLNFFLKGIYEIVFSIFLSKVLMDGVNSFSTKKSHSCTKNQI